MYGGSASGRFLRGEFLAPARRVIDHKVDVVLLDHSGKQMRPRTGGVNPDILASMRFGTERHCRLLLVVGIWGMGDLSSAGAGGCAAGERRRGLVGPLEASVLDHAGKTCLHRVITSR
jgi:hypothetical protein